MGTTIFVRNHAEKKELSQYKNGGIKGKNIGSLCNRRIVSKQFCFDGGCVTFEHNKNRRGMRVSGLVKSNGLLAINRKIYIYPVC